MASDPEQPAPRKRGRYNALAEASSLGFMFPIAIALGFFWGRWLDGMFGTAPWFTWIFSGFGLVAAFVNLFRFAARADAAEKREQNGS